MYVYVPKEPETYKFVEPMLKHHVCDLQLRKHRVFLKTSCFAKIKQY